MGISKNFTLPSIKFSDVTSRKLNTFDINVHPCCTSWWFFPTLLKNMRMSNWSISPNRDENKNYLKPPPSVSCIYAPILIFVDTLKIIDHHQPDISTTKFTSKICHRSNIVPLAPCWASSFSVPTIDSGKVKTQVMDLGSVTPLIPNPRAKDPDR